MDTTFSDVVKKVVTHYPLKVKNIYLLSFKGKKAVWSIQTDMGELIMKKVPFDETHIDFMLHAINYLKSNGVHTPAVIKTSSGQGYVKLNGEYFVVFETVYGHSPEYDNDSDLSLMLKGMATFHRASRGIESPNGFYPSYLLTKWKSDLQTRMERLKAWKEQRQQVKNKNEFDRVFLANVDNFVQQAQTALTTLNQPYFEQWVKETEITKTLCHQDFAAGNLVVGKDGKLYVYDMDSLTVDLPVRDMRKILNKVMKKGTSWNLPMMLKMMKFYQQVNPLTKEQYMILAADIQFPHLFYGQVSKYYENREDQWTVDKHIVRLKDMISTELSKNTVLKSFLARLDEVVKRGS
ncbi:CotS family spore coat protein [Paenibacillus sp. 5J-6]|uniref:CotS family spore coat protein n=1 Tax=Paenibacillus silvestris TaxID=2606219 RepID=A0A6L8V6J3_9BACL|nr:CotS family spore coat protein [Paenibacillus silvestris]MZQ86008.1 CotS family spore coat protein [Paenibacillus silvestris]